MKSLKSNVLDVNMNFGPNDIENYDIPLNCDVYYGYTLYENENYKKLEGGQGNNKRKFKFELNANDCTYTLLNMGISQTSDENMESLIGSQSFVEPSVSTDIRDSVSESKTGKTEAGETVGT